MLLLLDLKLGMADFLKDCIEPFYMFSFILGLGNY